MWDIFERLFGQPATIIRRRWNQGLREWDNILEFTAELGGDPTSWAPYDLADHEGEALP